MGFLLNKYKFVSFRNLKNGNIFADLNFRFLFIFQQIA